MRFDNYLISIGVLFRLWQGLSIIDIKNKIYLIAIFIINKTKIMNNKPLIGKLLKNKYFYIGNKIKVNNWIQNY
jgi:hypothetical protein